MNHEQVLIILDLLMPGIEGMSNCRKISQQSALENIPIIMFSAVDQTEITDHAFQAGVSE